MKIRKFARRPERTGLHQGLRWLGALATLHFILALPDQVGDVSWFAFLRMPVELPLLILVLIVAPGNSRVVLRALIIGVLTLMLFFKVANMATFFGFDRPFNPLVDAVMLPTVLDTLRNARGLGTAVAVVAGSVLIVAGVVALLKWSTGVVVWGISRPLRLPAAAVALAIAATGFTPLATFTASRFVSDQAGAIFHSLQAATAFRVQLAEVPLEETLPGPPLAGLKGVDVLLIFIESYGRTALENPAYAPLIRATLEKFEGVLKEKDFVARSAWMNSPTFGGESYLAHSSVVAGLWIDNQQRYVQLLHSARRTLIHEFADAGWRTVAVMPEITKPWPEAAYFNFAKIYSAPDLNYRGNAFGYMTMPDQYALAVFQRAELAPTERMPVMAEIALVSSHLPWAPIPKVVPWDAVGDGTVFNAARTPETAAEVWKDPNRIPEYYALSIDYTLQTLMSFVATYGRDKMLLIIVGDHQPMSFIAGDGASHEVPVHIVARDPALLAALDEGTWAEGMRPDPASPSWAMNTLRARILKAFSPPPDKTDATASTPTARPEAGR